MDRTLHAVFEYFHMHNFCLFAVFIYESDLHAEFLLLWFLLCQVIQQPKGVIVKPSLASAQVGLPAQKQTQPKQMVLQTNTFPTGISYAFPAFVMFFKRNLLYALRLMVRIIGTIW